MQQLLLGPSGSGKTARVMERLADLAQRGQQTLILLVPEQYSFVSERMLLERLGPAAAARVQVLSFTRLADTVFREVGGLAGERLDEGARALLMSRALELAAAAAEDRGETLLGARPQHAADAAYVRELTGLLEEMRQCAVSTEALEQTAQALDEALPQDGIAQTDGRRLPQKLHDLYQIFSAYEGLAAAAGMDELSVLTALADRLPESTLPEGAAVFVDGFKGFTAQELAVLERILPRAVEMTVTLGTDTPGRSWPGVPTALCRREDTLFLPVTETVGQLRRMAERHGLQWELCVLEENHRAAQPALAALERGLYAPQPTVWDGEAQTVTVTPCTDVYEECAYTAREIRRLLREEHYRCREITVVARSLMPYAGLLEDALRQAGIPCSMDERQDILCEPLLVYVRTALRLAVGGWSTEGILRLLKTDLGALEPLETAELENYVYLWQLDGAAWEREFTENPLGLGVPLTEAARAQLARLNDRRGRVMAPLVALRSALSGRVTGRAFAMALYRFLTARADMPQRVAAQAAALQALAEPLLARHAERLWDELIGILDRFALTLRDTPLPAARLEELFTLQAQLIDMGNIPQGLDAVTIGSADRIRYPSPRAVFILGANEGVFPAYPEGGGLLTEEDRRRLADCGLPLSRDPLGRCIEERYFVYMAVSAPSDRLTVTYQTGGGAAPSPLIGMLDAILPQHRRGTAEMPDGSDLETAEEAFARLAESSGTPTPRTAAIRQVIGRRPDFAGRLAAADRSAGRTPWRLEDPETGRRLFGSDMCLSASQTDRFYRCRFSYFCRYGLGLQPRRTAQVDAAAFGTVVHYVMETLLPGYTAEGGAVERLRAAERARAELPPEQAAADRQREQTALSERLQQDVRRTVEQYLADAMGGREHKSGRFLYQLQLAERSAVNMLWHTLMELRQSAFVPADYELTILPEPDPTGRTDGIVAMRLPFSGGSVRLTGKVDRVDLFIRFDGTAFVRVVDYKTGTKVFDLNELTAGLNMQMLLYLFIICDNSRRYLAGRGELQPAGVLYQPLADVTVPRGTADAERARLRAMRMNGLVLDDPGIVQAMEEQGEQVFIPAGLDKGGTVKGSAVTARQFRLLRGVVEQLLTRMAEQLLTGDIAAVPLVDGLYSPCDCCDYRAVCARDREEPVRSLQKRPMQAVLEELATSADGQDGGAEKEENGNGTSMDR